MNFCKQENQRKLRLYSTVRIEKDRSIYTGRVTMISLRGIDLNYDNCGKTFFVKWYNVKELVEE